MAIRRLPIMLEESEDLGIRQHHRDPFRFTVSDPTARAVREIVRSLLVENRNQPINTSEYIRRVRKIL